MCLLQLSTEEDVISHVKFLKHSDSKLSRRALASVTAKIVHRIWKETSIPIVNLKSIENKIATLISTVTKFVGFHRREIR